MTEYLPFTDQIAFIAMSQKDGRREASSSSSDRRSKGHSSKEQVGDKGMPSKFNRVRVADLLNADSGSPSRGKSRRDKPSSSDSDSPPQYEEVECKIGHCKRRFPSREALVAHQKRSHAAPTEFVCPHCKSSFSTPPNLNKHIRSVHEKVKPFKCDKCSSTFAFRDGLQRHKRMVHEQVRPFPCDHCNLRFKTKSHLLKHSYSLHSDAYKKASKGAGPSGHR